jgi:LysM domain
MAAHGRRPSPARVLAPVALLMCAGAVAFVVTDSIRSEDSDNGEAQSGQSVDQRPRQDGQQRRRRGQRAFYRVQLNDTLELIAEKTGVPVETLEVLNPELDPQTLVVGQRIRLRE